MIQKALKDFCIVLWMVGIRGLMSEQMMTSEHLDNSN